MTDTLPEGYDVAQKLYANPSGSSGSRRTSSAQGGLTGSGGDAGREGASTSFLPYIDPSNPPRNITSASSLHQQYQSGGMAQPRPDDAQDQNPYAQHQHLVDARAAQAQREAMHVMQNMVPAGLALSQIEKFRGMLREKEVECLKLRHENTLLKQVERRQQRSLDELSSKDEDAPRIIKGLRDEVTNLKHKLKLYFTQLSTDARHIRHLGEEKRRMREQVVKLQKLVEEEGLKQKEQLEREREDMRRELEVALRREGEAIKRAQLLEKNLSTDNRHLRGRVHALEGENVGLKTQVDNLEGLMKDKDREIASLSIYRYNAVHRKSEGACRSCAKREKEEGEARRRADIHDKLPELTTPKLELASSTSVDVDIVVPERWDPLDPNTNTQLANVAASEAEPTQTTATAEKHYEFSRVTLLCSDDPGMVENVRTLAVEIEGVKKKVGKGGKRKDGEEKGKKGRSRTGTADDSGGGEKVEKSAGGDGGEAKAEPPKTADPTSPVRVKYPSKTHRVTVVGLDPGRYYYFQVVAGHADVDGPPSSLAKMLVGKD
ncbi:hypothetical protein HK097_002852 [Rhizophlyctis rosea]|uniref:Lebercilin domain-containing protein n=1 Tax=Rhizophlyctis rosea TaxID=64517 RepID=A0AAD5SG71_9FUNG|nr:hypothetical protein HK097_002852 [Rhizophlyctis rosea]